MKEQCNKPRTMCPMCGKKLVAINRYSGKKVYYRKICDSCSRAKANGKKLRPAPPGWVRSGYKKKSTCEKCGFKLKLDKQSNVFYVDGNELNNNWLNLKTICLNCVQDIAETPQLSWKPAAIVPDF